MTTSYKTLNQIFYNNDNKFDVPESIHLLEKYFYKGGEPNANIEETVPTVNISVGTIASDVPQVIPQVIPHVPIIDTMSTIDTVTSIAQLQDMTTTTTKNKVEFNNEKPMVQKKFTPFLSDTIFWCIFYHVYGEIEYSNIKSKYGNRILQEKQKIMEHFQKTPKILKQTNVKMTNDRIKETLSEFMCGKNCSSFLETAAYSLYYDLTIYIIDDKNKTYLKFAKEDSDTESKNLCILSVSPTKNQNRKQYSLVLTDIDLTKVIDTYICLEQFDKPLKAMTHYKKIGELEEIAQKLGMNFTLSSKNKKQELYNLLAQKMAW
jgi:hypothetical protein